MTYKHCPVCRIMMDSKWKFCRKCGLAFKPRPTLEELGFNLDKPKPKDHYCVVCGTALHQVKGRSITCGADCSKIHNTRRRKAQKKRNRLRQRIIYETAIEMFPALKEIQP
jgi:predicted nucleic acid-binding Zn ribbon protein